MGISVSSTVNLANTKQRMSLGGRELDWSLVPSAGKVQFVPECHTQRWASLQAWESLPWLRKRAAGGCSNPTRSYQFFHTKKNAPPKQSALPSLYQIARNIFCDTDFSSFVFSSSFLATSKSSIRFNSLFIFLFFVLFVSICRI